MNIHTLDKNNKKIIIDETENHQIMMEWEKDYMKECIKKLNPFGDVLEVGFGLGFSATEIQKYPINSYTIVECDKITCQKIFEWSKKYDNKITIIEDKWENVYEYLPKFDTIFFDDYDAEYGKITENNKSIPCRNAFFIRQLKNNLKNFVRYSFYCSLYDEDVEGYKHHWNTEKIIENYNFTCQFDEFNTSVVPENCNYIGEKKLYCPIINIRKEICYL